MKMVWRILWYLGVLLAAVVLVLAVLTKNWVLTILAMVLAVVLKVTNRHIPLPRVYRDLGVRNEVFEGKSRSELKKIYEEKNSQTDQRQSEEDPTSPGKG